jgi:hypothetical protein
VGGRQAREAVPDLVGGDIEQFVDPQAQPLA